MNNKSISCMMCGACCVAYSISSLNKPTKAPCIYLNNNGICKNYNNRPDVCQSFKADELCILISTLPFKKKIDVLVKLYED